MRAILFLILAIIFMFADRRNIAFHRVRQAMDYVVFPIQYVVDLPIDMTNTIIDDFSTQQQLLKDNASLHAQVLLLQAQLQKQYAIVSENKQLKELLSASDKTSGQVLVAQLLAVSSDPFLHQVILDKGTKDEVFQGQPVLDSSGVMGQVIQADVFTSRVMLLTDPKSAIPVQIKRNGIRAIAAGSGGADNLLKLVYVTNTTDIEVGDELVTSGLGQCYPVGYPVGTVITVSHPADSQFAEITVAPSARLNRSRLVLLVWPLKV
ncbi:MAG: rod shape-determining protein MreC [Gammaproteobacteria bacterium RIFCSPHIGHO2_02_FULL_42_13]|nr:MAG: rod shape-determining protein MreC [Gammaproteobacteria bacterium RIFCSPHIGHO2_02_FULL_42_13]OGT67839.1 MAG: rod shape-determining protein MreC [Gammaproteobacteria bacterium RIFCSPLOWO2_02_FULL_42_9]